MQTRAPAKVIDNAGWSTSPHLRDRVFYCLQFIRLIFDSAPFLSTGQVVVIIILLPKVIPDNEVSTIAEELVVALSFPLAA